MDQTSDQLFEVLVDRLRRETAAFEKREDGKPFLPADQEMKSQEFADYCLDIERILGCDPWTLGAATDAVRPMPSLYHVNWMCIPRAALFLDRLSFEPLVTIEGRTVWPRDVLGRLLGEVEATIRGETAFLPRYMDGGMDSMRSPVMEITFPFLLTVYRSGKDGGDPPGYYAVRSCLFQEGDDANLTNVQGLLELVRQGNDGGFYSLHYTALPNEARNEEHPAAAHSTLVGVEAALRAALADPDRAEWVGRRLGFVEALTLHFQRQWADRESQLLAASHSQSAISHDLCHDLYDALQMLRKARAGSIAGGPHGADVVHYIAAAEESVRACFAGPFLMRFRTRTTNKPMAPIWCDPPRPPTSEEIAELLEAFDARMQTICDAERPIGASTWLERRFFIDGKPHGEPLRIDLGAPPEARVIPVEDELAFAPLWPLSADGSASTIDREGQRAMLFAPQSELIRNAVSAMLDMDSEALRQGIQVEVNVASDGRSISGSVRNGLRKGHGVSGARRGLKAKIEAMSIGLTAGISAANGCFVVEWRLALDGSRKAGNGNHA